MALLQLLRRSTTSMWKVSSSSTLQQPVVVGSSPVFLSERVHFGTASVPSAYDVIVDVTILDKAGHRHVLRGRVGQKLAELIAQNSHVLGEDVVGLSSDGGDMPEVHVKVPNELFEEIPEPKTVEERKQLQFLAENSSIDIHSRLASTIVLTHNLNGALFALSDLRPWKSL